MEGFFIFALLIGIVYNLLRLLVCNAHDILQSSFLGGDVATVNAALFSPSKNHILLAGETTTTSFPQTSNSIPNQTLGRHDGFISIIEGQSNLL